MHCTSQEINGNNKRGTDSLCIVISKKVVTATILHFKGYLLKEVGLDSIAKRLSPFLNL